MIRKLVTVIIAACLLFSLSGCGNETPSTNVKTVPHNARWGIYELDLATEEVKLIHSSATKLEFLNLNKAGDTFAFSQQFGGTASENEEICTIKITGEDFRRITNNNLMDVYPVWSPQGTQMAFLSLRTGDLDIYLLEVDNGNESLLYNSGDHDADIDWLGDKIVFTANSQIWIMQDDGTNPIQLTNPPNAGVWGNANLPFGDYDPRLSPNGQIVVFERLEDDTSIHGNYNMFAVNADGSGETRLTDNGYTQGIVSWSHSGDRLVFIISGINDEGKYDIYMMDADGSNITNINPDYFPPDFLCYTPVFSADDSKIYFIGEWWE